MLAAKQLRKAYVGRSAVAEVSISVAAGEIIGLLGPNGAGKTTTISMLCGLTPPDSGSVSIKGRSMHDDLDAAKRRIGLVPQDIALYENLSAIRNLETVGALYGLNGAELKRRAGEALAMVGLADRARDKPATFSGGMKRRLNIACALVHDPDILLLDEPTVGIDPQSRNAIFDNLEQLKARGKALIYTTHYMEEVERLCDRVVIMDHGKVIASDTLAGLYRQLPAAQSLTIELEGIVNTGELKTLAGVKSVQQQNGRLIIGMDDLAATSAPVLAWLAQRGHRLNHIASDRANLESLFLNLTGRQLRD